MIGAELTAFEELFSAGWISFLGQARHSTPTLTHALPLGF